MQHLIDAAHPNLLPAHGEAVLFPDFFTPRESDIYFDYFKNDVSWKQEPVVLFGKKRMQPRLTALYGDINGEYSYSGLTMGVNDWTSPMAEIKEKLEKRFETSFNSCLFNYYRDGKDYMGWHRDNEHALGEYPLIVSVSFGSTRIFQFRDYKEKMPVISLELDHGSVLLMKRQTQEYWEHRLPKTTLPVGPRINLTFRLLLHKG
ncbi:2OG-Fe(II) oxygenase [Pedobacter lusitanus]|uniref:2OG-Fe(II) oxygenase n=1 Tax=Pedobacter lusitanus TaxID=1503925 RepID=A0A0D0GPY6_9SPHI|nr:alpha-ketoglutarate-dependent dioxygenase AlkB [Pedobacter lusitanus]KIO78240.1 2OG-Fe(II) oxygenase [Pedobacter lusitanus]